MKEGLKGLNRGELGMIGACEEVGEVNALSSSLIKLIINYACTLKYHIVNLLYFLIIEQ